MNPLLATLLEGLLLKPIQKAVTYGFRQTSGKNKGDAEIAANQPIINAAEQAAAGSLADVATAHLTNDKVAKTLGIPTTEDGLVSAAANLAGGQLTLNLSDQNTLINFLTQNIVRASSGSVAPGSAVPGSS